MSNLDAMTTEENGIQRLYPQRRYPRLKGYNYASVGAYFVTICTQYKVCLFGHIEGATMKLNSLGEAVALVWRQIPVHYPEADNEVFVVMPNHVHGIIEIRETERSGLRPDPTKACALPEIIRAFKTYSSRKINELRKSTGMPVWQRSYYEHVIRDEADYGRVGEYILSNPVKWATDRENPSVGQIPNQGVVGSGF